MAGAPPDARSLARNRAASFPLPLLNRIVRTALSTASVLGIEPLTDGLRNTNLKLRVDVPPGVIVLKFFEHDASLCQKEVDLMKLVGASVPVPELLHAEPNGLDEVPPFCLMRFVDGISFRDLVRQRDPEATAQAAYSAGATLAAIGRTSFSRSGWLGPGPTVRAPLLEGDDPMPRFVDQCLASPSLERRVPAELRAALHDRLWAWAPQLALLGDEAHLVHGDFSRRNLLVHQVAGCWSVASVLDWEFAVASSPVADFGNFLRYEHPTRTRVEPRFSTGYLDAGGRLPPDWWRLARIVDLIALCERLTRDELPADVEAELVELCRATAEDREPDLG